MHESPRRPASLPVIPPVDRATAVRPFVSMATHPTLSHVSSSFTGQRAMSVIPAGEEPGTLLVLSRTSPFSPALRLFLAGSLRLESVKSVRLLTSFVNDALQNCISPVTDVPTRLKVGLRSEIIITLIDSTSLAVGTRVFLFLLCLLDKKL